MLSIWKSIKNEFMRSPVGTSGAIAAVLALFIANPEILNVTNTSESEIDPTTNNPAGLVTWVLLYVAVCYLLAKWSSMALRAKVSSGFFLTALFGIMAITIGVYLASVYLGGFPIIETILPETEQSGPRTVHKWVGLGTPVFAAVIAGIWVLLTAALVTPEAVLHDRGPDIELTAVAASMLGFLSVLFLVFWGLGHALIFGLVDTTAVSTIVN